MAVAAEAFVCSLFKTCNTTAWAGFNHDTGLVTIGPHGVQHCRVGAVQLHQNIASVPLKRIGLKYTSFPSRLRARRKLTVRPYSTWGAVQTRSPGKAFL